MTDLRHPKTLDEVLDNLNLDYSIRLLYKKWIEDIMLRQVASMFWSMVLGAFTVEAILYWFFVRK